MRSLAPLLISLAMAASVGCKAKKGQEADRSDDGSEVQPAIITQKPAAQFRLDDTAAPTRYDVDLSIDPEKESFSGNIKIAIKIAKETDTIWMHGRELDIAKATIKVGDRVLELTTKTAPNSLLGFVSPEPLKPGAAIIEVAYTGRIVRRDGSGVFAEKEGDHWYQYTQFESLDGRRAFPCFDEPRWKTPWKLSIETAADLVAVSNTPIENETKKGERKVVSFMETKALPTYLVAFGVGPFEFVDAGKSKTGVPMRIVVPKGRAPEAAYAAKVNKEILARLESYFGSPYPYRKLDTLIIPTTQGFGAMEHPGLITFASRLALWKPEQETYNRRRRFALIQAHEIGHQWFGNLVTMPWWDDIWLNEAFSSWVESRVLLDWRPKWRLAAYSMDNKDEAMLADSLGSARRIREPVNDENSVESAFDSITYEKGEAVINMFETYVGRAAWQKGIQAYLTKYAWKTATATDFLEAMSKSTGKDITTPFNTFLEQNGVPLIKMKLNCGKGAARLELEQSRYLPIGSKASGQRKWQIPVCVTHSGGSGCTLLAEERGTIDLGRTCPTWLNPNKGGVGYYRSDIGKELRGALAKVSATKLSLPERLSQVSDLEALVRSKTSNADIEEAFELIKALASDRDPLLNLSAVRLGMSLLEMIEDSDLPRYSKFINSTFESLVGSVGLAPKRGEREAIGQLRPELLELFGAIGEDSELATVMKRLAGGWLAGEEAIDPALLEVVLALAARGGDQELLDTLASRAKVSTNRIERQALLGALGHFRFDLTDSALALAIDDEIDARNAIEILRAAAGWPSTRNKVVTFVMENYLSLSKRLSESQLAVLPRRLNTVCDSELRRKMATFFAGTTAKLPGGELELKQSLEAIDLCVAARRAQAGKAKAYLPTP